MSLYKEFKDWMEYNLPQLSLDEFQEDVIRAILYNGVPQDSKELADRLKKLLPKSKSK